MLTVLLATACLNDPSLKTCEDAPQAEACRMDGAVVSHMSGSDAVSSNTALDSTGAPTTGQRDIGPEACIEGDRRPCSGPSGACEDAEQVCQADGDWGNCIGPEEVCNGTDDDCDGSIDEDSDEVCGVNLGLCSEGIARCVSGILSTCDAEHLPGTVPEVCNALDDDCDGIADENLSALDHVPVPVVRAEGAKLGDLASSGSLFGIVYARATGRTGDGVEFIRVGLDGRAEGSALDLSYRNVTQTYTVVATAIAPWQGMGEGGFVVAWIDHEGSGEPMYLRFVYLSPDGIPVGTTMEWPIEGVTGSIGAAEHRLDVATGDGGSVAIVLDAGLGMGVFYVYKGGFAGNALSAQRLSEDDYGASIVHMGGRRFVAAHSRYRSMRCPDTGCTEENNPGGIYLTELDGANLLRQQRVLYGDEYDFPHLVRDQEQLVLFSWRFVAPQYLVTYLPINAQDWTAALELPTQINISPGTLHPADADLAMDGVGGPARIVAVWADERSETPEAYMRTLLLEADTWFLAGSDEKIAFGRDTVERVHIASMGPTFGVLFESSSRGEGGGLFFSSGALSCPSLD